jgi:hypothetical protein
MQKETLKPTYYLSVTPQTIYPQPKHSVSDCVKDTLKYLRNHYPEQLAEIGEVAVNEDGDTLRITSPFKMIGDDESALKLKAMIQIIEDLKVAGYYTVSTSEDLHSTYTNLTA